MDSLRIAFIYVLFFLSGAAALMYEVIWVRSLGLVFGGTHLAVAVVLSVFMGGLALGSYLIGSRVDAVRKPLRLRGADRADYADGGHASAADPLRIQECLGRRRACGPAGSCASGCRSMS